MKATQLAKKELTEISKKKSSYTRNLNLKKLWKTHPDVLWETIVAGLIFMGFQPMNPVIHCKCNDHIHDLKLKLCNSSKNKLIN
jgi:hypothetical protein